jgi:hypothetical protein
VIPATAYINNFWSMWSIAVVPLVFAVLRGWRHAPMLPLVAFVNLASHSLIGHKGCMVDAASPFTINDVLARIGL